MKVLFTVPTGERSCKEISEAILNMGYELERLDEFGEIKEHEDTDTDILVCYDPFSKIDFRNSKKLKAVITSSTGIDQIPDYILENESIQIMNNNSAYAVPIAEWIVMYFLMGLKNFPKVKEKQKEKNWVLEKNTLEAIGKSILFLGAGGIATEAAKRLKSFDVETIAFRRTRKENPNFDRTVFEENIDDEIKKADCVVACLPDNETTRNFMNAERISLMRDDSIFINISRGVVVDEDALVKALDDGKFRFVALDVVKDEPLSKDSKLWNMDRLFLSSHVSWISQMRPVRMKKNIIDNLESFLKTGKLIGEVNRELKY